jgi:2-dehydropantoate 2-reductase
MRIAVLGAGAMGSLFGGYLSRHNEVWLVDINRARVNKINHDRTENGYFIPKQ